MNDWEIVEAAHRFALLLLLGALWRGRNGVTISGRGGWRPDFGVARQVLSIGIPAALEQVHPAAAPDADLLALTSSHADLRRLGLIREKWKREDDP